MTRRDVILKAIEGRITWTQAASICRLTPRHMARLRERYERLGMLGLRDGRTGKRQPSDVPATVVAEICRLKREVYPDFSMRHFHEFAQRRHGLELGYTWTRDILQAHGVVDKAPARGKYRRKRERRPMRGMMVHMDASTHPWVAGLPSWDLFVALDDADGRILYARFVEQEGTRATLQALEHIIRRWGRFCELYTDRGSHFAPTVKPGTEPSLGQVQRVLRVLGIRQILANSPEARGRSERCFGTLQGRLPQELRLAGVREYGAANRYLSEVFVPAFNTQFTVEPQSPESAFVSVAGIDLSLLMSVQHERVVQKDNTVIFGPRQLQLRPTDRRMHYARCPVVVHELLDDTLAVSYQGQVIARFTADGAPVVVKSRRAA